jgi:hypothetical protein
VKTGQGSIRVRDIAVVRGGDKGDNCHIAIVPTARGAYDALWEQLTPEFIRASLPGICDGDIQRYRLPNIEGIVLVLERALGGGGSRGWVLDRRMPLASHIADLAVQIEPDPRP